MFLTEMGRRSRERNRHTRNYNLVSRYNTSLIVLDEALIKRKVDLKKNGGVEPSDHSQYFITRTEVIIDKLRSLEFSLDNKFCA